MPSTSRKMLLRAMRVRMPHGRHRARAGRRRGGRSSGGGATFTPPPPPPEKATLVNGRLIAPASAPVRVERAIEAANRIVEKPYSYGGGHKLYRRAVLDSRLRLLGRRLLRALRRPLPALAAALAARSWTGARRAPAAG